MSSKTDHHRVRRAIAAGIGFVSAVGLAPSFGWQVVSGPPTQPTLAIRPPAGDYGDAPDGTPAHYPAPFQAVVGNFPTRFVTASSRYGLPGGHTTNCSQEWLGSVVSLERGPRDIADTDLIENFVDDDFDDGMSGGPCPVGPPAFPFPPLVASTLTFNVTVAAGAPAGTRYINILLDRNLDGVWSNAAGNTEWVAIDVPVSVAPGTSGPVTVGPIAWPLTPVTGWLRVALTRTPVVGSFADNGTGWDGSGAYSHGEVEDYLVAGALAFASDAAGASDSAAHFAASADFAYDFANPPDALDFALVDVTAYASAVATAHASASAAASAAASASAEAGAYAASAASAVAAAQASATAIAAACISCPCATLCAAAGVNASAAVLAATQAYASAQTVAAASATAVAHANAQVSVTATAQVDMSLHVTAFAAAYASAQAEAMSYATALALAQAHAASSASAAAAAFAAACAGDAHAAAAAAAQAAAYAQASAFALTDAHAYAEASATAWADARISLQLMIRVRASAQAAASASAFAGAASAAFASAAAQSEAAAVAAAASMASAFAMVAGACSGDCCPPSPCITGDRYRNGATSSGSTRVGTSVSTWTMVGVSAGAAAGITGFRWQSADAGAAGYAGMSDVSVWPASLVQGGGAGEFNPMFMATGIPTTRTPVTNDCGQPLLMFGAPVFEYTAMLPGPFNVPPGESIYVGVRGVGSGSYNCRLLSAHRDADEPAMPSYYLAPSQGILSAVPVSQVLNCDHDFVVQSLGHE